MAFYNIQLPTSRPGPGLPVSAWSIPKPPTIAGNLGNIGGVVKPNLNTQFTNQPIGTSEQQAWGEQIYGKQPRPIAGTPVNTGAVSTPQPNIEITSQTPTIPYDFQGAFNGIYSMNPQNIWSKIFGDNPMDGGFMGEFQNFLNNYRTKRWGRE